MTIRLTSVYCLMAIGCSLTTTLAQEARKAESGADAREDQVFSGPQPGEALAPFRVLQVASPDKVRTARVTPDADETTLIVFSHRLSEPALGLMMTLEWYTSRQKELASHYVLLTEDREKTEANAKRWMSIPLFARSPVAISLDGPEGPGRYGLNRTVDMTVLLAKENKVVASYAVTAPNDTDAPRLLGAIADALGKPHPSHEKIRKEMRAERDRRRARRRAASPLFKLAPNEAVGRLMVNLIQTEDRSEAYAKRAAGRLSAWAGDDQGRRGQLREYAGKVLDANFEMTRYAREALERLAGRDAV